MFSFTRLFVAALKQTLGFKWTVHIKTNQELLEKLDLK